MSPTARLQQLLTESRNMVKSLEDSPDLSSIRSSPDQLFLVSQLSNNETNFGYLDGGNSKGLTCFFISFLWNIGAVLCFSDS